jgi:gliding-associated putative ABC transporter substrate-binding component GldG
MKKQQAVIITFLTVVCVVLACLTFARPNGGFWSRLDLTKDKAYTISKVSKNLYTDISDIVTINYYISSKLEQISPIPDQIEELLQEYAQYSHGKIKYKAIDPSSAGLESYMQSLGIAPRQINTVRQNQASVSLVYSGIMIEYQNKTSVLPFIFDTRTLEYDMTSRIRYLVRGETRSIGILLGNPDQNLEQNYPTLGNTLRSAGYSVQEIVAGNEVPPSLKALIVIDGVDTLNDWDLYRIDYYIRNGGKVMFMLDTLSIEPQSMQVAKLKDKGLLAMLKSYGADVQQSLVLDVSCQPVTYTSQQGIPMMVKYPLWLDVPPQMGNADSPITQRFEGAYTFWASPVVLTSVNGIKEMPLFTTTPKGWLMTKDFSIIPGNDFAFTAEQKATLGVHDIAACLQGKFPSYFEGKPLPANADKASKDTLPAMPKAASESRIVVLGDGDFASEQYAGQNAVANMDFVVQASDWLGSDDDIISIRNRQSAAGPLNKITDQAKRNTAMATASFVNEILMPVLVLIVMILVLVLRRYNLRKRDETAMAEKETQKEAQEENHDEN